MSFDAVLTAQWPRLPHKKAFARSFVELFFPRKCFLVRGNIGFKGGASEVAACADSMSRPTLPARIDTMSSCDNPMALRKLGP